MRALSFDSGGGVTVPSESSERTRVACGQCGARYAVDLDRFSGRVLTLRCKRCHQPINVDRRGVQTVTPVAVRGEKCWFVVVNGERVGPITAQEIRDRAARSDLTPYSYAWRQGMASWQRLVDIELFVDVLESSRRVIADLEPLAEGGGGEVLTPEDGEPTRIVRDPGEDPQARALVDERPFSSSAEADEPTRVVSVAAVSALASESALRGTFTSEVTRRSAWIGLGEEDTEVPRRTGGTLVYGATPVAEVADVSETPVDVVEAPSLTAARGEGSVLFSLDAAARQEPVVRFGDLEPVPTVVREIAQIGSWPNDVTFQAQTRFHVGALDITRAEAPQAAQRSTFAVSRMLLLGAVLLVAGAASMFLWHRFQSNPSDATRAGTSKLGTSKLGTSKPRAPAAVPSRSAVVAEVPQHGDVAARGPASSMPDPALVPPAEAAASQPAPQLETVPQASAVTDGRASQSAVGSSAPTTAPVPVRNAVVRPPPPVAVAATPPTRRNPSSSPNRHVLAARDRSRARPAVVNGVQPAVESAAPLAELASASGRVDRRELSIEQIEDVMRRVEPETLVCQERFSAVGVLTLSLRVEGRSGRVVGGKVLSTFADTPLARCVLDAVRASAHFPRFSPDATMTFTWPLFMR